MTKNKQTFSGIKLEVARCISKSLDGDDDKKEDFDREIDEEIDKLDIDMKKNLTYQDYDETNSRPSPLKNREPIIQSTRNLNLKQVNLDKVEVGLHLANETIFNHRAKFVE